MSDERRVKIKKGWGDAGQEGVRLGANITDGGIEWAPVKWDCDPDPSWHKAAGLDDEVIHCEEPVHEYYGLSYKNFTVIHRSIAQSMPFEWQRDFVRLLREADKAVDDNDVETADSYELIAQSSQGFEDVEDDDGEFAEIEVFKTIDDPVPHYWRGRTKLWGPYKHLPPC